MTQTEDDDEIEQLIRKFTLQNASQYSGQANSKAVIGKVLGDHPELRSRAKEILPKINSIISEINSKSETEIKRELEVLAPELLHKEKREKHKELPELDKIQPGKPIVMRFAPGPSGPLHIGHSRAIILNDEYVKRYSGKFIVRFEDTNPQNIDPDAYDMIPDDLKWLEVKYHKIFKQSERFDLYLEYAKKLIEQGHAYICTCNVEHWRGLKTKQQSCPDRELPSNIHIERWEKLIAREYEPGQVSMIIKTDLTHPNPAIRDFVGMRIVTQPHPITGDKYYVYPTYNLSVAIDDHLMGITHILRGKDHLNNTYRQKFIYNYFNWELPEFLHYGWVSLPDVILKTTLIKDGIRSGKYSDWSDIQLGTLQAISRRGIQPEAIRKYWLDIGVKDVDITFSWQTLYAINKNQIDSIANRYFFAWSPISLVITGIDKLISHAPIHPDFPLRGARESELVGEIDENGNDIGIEILVTKDDIEELKPGTKLRLKDLGNIELTSVNVNDNSIAKYIGNDLELIKEGVKIIHWVSKINNKPTQVYLPDGEIKKGFCEKAVLASTKKIVQFERFGFVNLGDFTADTLIGWFAHK